MAGILDDIGDDGIEEEAGPSRKSFKKPSNKNRDKTNFVSVTARGKGFIIGGNNGMIAVYEIEKVLGTTT